MGKNKSLPGFKDYNTSKQPATDPKYNDYTDSNPSWQFQNIDLGGLWSWDKADKNKIISDLLPKIKNFESMLWKNILNSNNHIIPISKISSPALKRIEALKIDDIENLISLRISGKERIWGIKSGNVLKLLWWDPEHSVYPIEKSHT